MVEYPQQTASRNPFSKGPTKGFQQESEVLGICSSTRAGGVSEKKWNVPKLVGLSEKKSWFLIRRKTSWSRKENQATQPTLVSFTAVVRVVTQHSSPTNGCSLELCIPFLTLTNKKHRGKRYAHALTSALPICMCDSVVRIYLVLPLAVCQLVATLVPEMFVGPFNEMFRSGRKDWLQ